MSTRGIFGFRLDGKDYLTYNHCDSYPSWLGVQIAKFVTEKVRENVSKTVDLVRALRLVSEKDTPTGDDIRRCEEANTIDLGVGRRSKSDWYCLLREAHGDPEKVLSVGIMIDSHGFILDSLFCGWGYIINLDTEMLEVWEGFQKEPCPSNRYGSSPDGEYYPCKMIREIPFCDVSENVMTSIEGSEEE